MSFFDALALTFLNNLPADSQAQLLQQAMAFVQAQGGVNGLVDKFHSQGLGSTIESWIAPGPNQGITSEQVHQVFGPAEIQALADKLGVDPSHVATGLAQILPNLVDKLTPNGNIPANNELEASLAGIIQQGLGKLLS